ncbi:Por secretion system C-terminal sorting domain-containing protein, partial [Candidatus Thermokryptus mobilis]
WTIYNASNSGLPSNYINAIAIDGQDNLWIGTEEGLAKFDGVNWTVYNSSNSGLPSKYVNAIAFDKEGNKWIGTNNGLAKFDGVNWTVYKTYNSGLPDNSVKTIVIDISGNKWIGTWGYGLAVYREGGVIIKVEDEKTKFPEKYVLYQNYPNPFNPNTKIEFELPEKANIKLTINDILGREIEKLVDKEYNSGKYQVEFNGSNLPGGVYFYRLEAGKFVSVKKMILLK